MTANQVCYKCGEGFGPYGPEMHESSAPGAANGGTMLPVHSKCSSFFRAQEQMAKDAGRLDWLAANMLHAFDTWIFPEFNGKASTFREAIDEAMAQGAK